MRILARFLVIGGALFGARRLALHVLGHDDAPRRALVVRVESAASETRIHQEVDEAILVDLALRAGWARSDPVVRERILKSLEAIKDVHGDPNRAIERGLAMGIPTKDPVARSRLVTAARRTIEDGAAARSIDDDEVARYVAAHPESFRVPARVRIEQVFLGRERRGERLDADTAAVAARLARGGDLPDSELRSLGDPLPLSLGSAASRGAARGPWLDETRLDSLMGGGFGRAVVELPTGVWSGPIRSSFGVHFVKVVELESERIATVPEARSRVVERIAREDRAAAFDVRMAELRGLYAVAIEREP